MTTINQKSTTVGTLFPNLKLQSSKRTCHLSDHLGQQNVVLQFICHFSCSRCWHSILWLDQLYASFQDLNTAVLVIGSGDHHCPASQLADDLNILFPLLTTATNAVHFLPDGEDVHLDAHFNATVLLDMDGVVLHGQFIDSPTAAVDANALLAAAAYPDDGQVRVGDTHRKAPLVHPVTTGTRRLHNVASHHPVSEPCYC